MIQKKLSRILFFVSFIRIIKAFICVSHATVLLDETNAQNPILAHNLQIPIISKEKIVDYLTIPSGTSLTEIPFLISQARQSKHLSPYIHLNQQDEILNNPWYVNDDMFEECPLPGQVIKIYRQKGQKVTRGQKICMIETMKMENIIRSSIDGEVIDILVQDGDQVGIQPILKLRPSKWESINFQDLLDNQKILSTLYPWEISTKEALSKEDLIPILYEKTEKQSEFSQSYHVPITTDIEPKIVNKNQLLKSHLRSHTGEENAAQILPENNDAPFKTYEIYDTFQPDPIPEMSDTEPKIIYKYQFLILTIPSHLGQESITQIQPKNNDTCSIRQKRYEQSTLMRSLSEHQKERDLKFSKKISHNSLEIKKQITFSSFIYTPQATSNESSALTTFKLFKASIFIDRFEEKSFLVQKNHITTKKYYWAKSINFLSQELDLINFMSFTNILKKLYLLITLCYLFLLGACFRKREISIKISQSKILMPTFYKKSLNQNFSSVKHIKHA